ncbi:MAG: hypothetical protein JW873_01380 [Candidatus Saganbacteria bacterium]|nr:hypothetical protein [Candidatus Saganbacteria bacterium]
MSGTIITAGHKARINYCNFSQGWVNVMRLTPDRRLGSLTERVRALAARLYRNDCQFIYSSRRLARAIERERAGNDSFGYTDRDVWGRVFYNFVRKQKDPAAGACLLEALDSLLSAGNDWGTVPAQVKRQKTAELFRGILAGFDGNVIYDITRYLPSDLFEPLDLQLPIEALAPAVT